MKTFWAIVVCVLACGCGTAMNLWRPCSGGAAHLPEPYRIYGGVRADVEMAAAALQAAPDATKEAHHSPQPIGQALVAACCAVDLPLSCVADTLTLPLTIVAALNSRHHESEPPPPRLGQVSGVESPR
jgi:uncharacterized protein YceK